MKSNLGCDKLTKNRKSSKGGEGKILAHKFFLLLLSLTLNMMDKEGTDMDSYRYGFMPSELEGGERGGRGKRRSEEGFWLFQYHYILREGLDERPFRSH